MRISVYDKIGRITKVLDIPAEVIPYNVDPTEMYIEGFYRGDEYYVEYGKAVAKPPKPADWAKFDYGTKVWFDPRTEEDLLNEIVEAKTNTIAAINNAIGVIRSKFITVIPAQDMLYQAKEAEAKAYLTDADPVVADYPFIHAEIGITGQDAWQVAQVYVNQAMILRQVAAQLETVRLGHIAMVEAATDVEAIDAALLAFEAIIQAVQ